MGCLASSCCEEHSKSWYAVVSAPEFDPNPGKNGMGQIWVRTKNHPGAEKLWGGFLLSVLAKKQCWLHSNCRNGDGRCWRYPTKNERKPQVTKPGVLGCGGRICTYGLVCRLGRLAAERHRRSLALQVMGRGLRSEEAADSSLPRNEKSQALHKGVPEILWYESPSGA